MEAKDISSPHEDQLCAALLTLLARRDNIWSGTDHDLLRDINGIAAVPESGWPGNGRMLRQWLRTINPQLHALGLTLTYHRLSGQRRLTITKQS